MTDGIKELTTNLFGGCPWLGIILIAMVPVIELRGAIPFALSIEFWGANVLPWWQAFLFAVIGSTLPALIIVPALKPVFSWMKKTKIFRKLATNLENKFLKKSANISESYISEQKKHKITIKKFMGVMVFVAVPLPLTGARTGSAIAAYLNLPYFYSIAAVFFGNIIAGTIMICICLLFPGAESIIMYCFLGLAVVLVVGSVIWTIKKNRSEIKADSNKNSNMTIKDKNNDSI